MYNNRTSSGGRPEADVIVMFKMLVLQQWHGLSDANFGYKLHTIIDKDYELIRKFETTTALVHDSNVDLSEMNEVTYKDKGYFGVVAKGYAATMQRAVRGHPLGIRDIRRNKRISVNRAQCERVYAVVKEVLKAGKVLVTTVERVNLKMLMTAFCFNLHQMRTLKSKGII